MTMRCKKAMAQFSAYLDGHLTAAERKAVRAHLTGCARCRAELDALDHTAYAVADLPRRRAPSDLRDRVMAKLEGVTPAEARHPPWRMYWGAAAAVVFAVVIMLLTRSPTPHRAAPESAASAPKSIPRVEVAVADRSVSEGPKNAEENVARTVSNVQPVGGAAIAPGVPAVAYTPVVPLRLNDEMTVFSENPQSTYLKVVAIATERGWLPTELRKDGEIEKAAEAEKKEPGGRAEPQHLTLRMRRSEEPLLEKELAGAAPRAFEVKGRLAEDAKSVSAGAPGLARAEAHVDEAAQPAAAARVAALPRSADRAQPANAPMAAAAPAGAGGAFAANARQLPPESAAQETDRATLQQARKTGPVEDPIVEVTLRFELWQSFVPAAAPATGPATSATPQ
jgi:anti-sigma factor (TIGR02949 family)